MWNIFHLIRCIAATYDTGLSEIRDVKVPLLKLPLSSESVFGTGLEAKFKERRDKSQQLKELLPPVDANRSYKRQYPSTSTNTVNKRIHG